MSNSPLLSDLASNDFRTNPTFITQNLLDNLRGIAEILSSTLGSPAVLLVVDNVSDQPEAATSVYVGLPSDLDVIEQSGLLDRLRLTSNNGVFAISDFTPEWTKAESSASQSQIRFVAGINLKLQSGHTTGYLCMGGYDPRNLSDIEQRLFLQLAQVAVATIESQRALLHQYHQNGHLNHVKYLLSESESRFKALCSASPLGIFATDTEGNCTYTNPRWQEIYDLSEEQALGDGWQLGLHPDDREKVYLAWKNNAPRGREFSSSFRVRHGDGRIRTVKAKAKPIKDRADEITAWVGTVEDVTSYQQAIDDIAKSERRFRELYEGTPVMMMSISPKGVVLNVSNLWLSQMGHSRASVAGHSALEFFLPAARSNAQTQLLSTLFIDGQCNGIEFQLLKQNGETMDIELSAVVEYTEQHEPIRALIVIQNITLQKAAERTNSALLAAIEAHFIVTETNSNGTLTAVNDSFCRVSGYDRHELLGQNHRIVNSDFHDDSFFRGMWQTISGGKAWRGEIRNRTKAGQYYWVDSVIVPFFNAQNQVERYISIRSDISQRKEQEQALRKSQALFKSAGEMAGIGGWELTLATGDIYWSDETCAIHGVPQGYKPTLDEAIQYYAPEARPVIQQAVDVAIRTGVGWDLELPFIQSNGNRIWVRALGNAEFENGEPVRLLGAFQNITERVSQRLLLEDAYQTAQLATDSGGIGIWEYDPVTQHLRWDHWMYRLYGLPPTSSGSYESWLLCLHPDNRDAVRDALQTALSGLGPFDTEFRIIQPDGQIRYLRATAHVVWDVHGQAVKMIGANWDVTTVRELSKEVAEQHKLFQVTLQSIDDAVITTNSEGMITWLNPTAERLTGWTTESALGKTLKSVFTVVSEETRSILDKPIAVTLTQRRTVRAAHPSVLVSKTGEEIGIDESFSPIVNENQELLGAVVVFRDVTERRRINNAMRYQASHDALTDLFNRSEFESRLHDLVSRPIRMRGHHAVMYIDLDQFKIVNDTCGHMVGDQLLQQVSRLLASRIRADDVLARLGGDEFGVILSHCSTEDAERIAGQMCDTMENFRFLHGTHRFRVGTSIGVVALDYSWLSTTELLQAADSACYTAKAAGRNRVHVWRDNDPTMRARVGEIQWVSRIEQALDEDRFVLFAQRIQGLTDEQAGLHAEVLLRMTDLDGSFILPASFLPAAERFHLASRIDRWVLRHAIDWLVTYSAQCGIATLCINLSGQSIGDKIFHRDAVAIFKECGPEICHMICLEITETSAITHLEDAAAFIEQLNTLGIRIALDDFGAGVSSFGYLKRLHANILKIDGQFVKNLLDDPLDDVTVRCFVDVASVVGLKTVAEFVDRPEIYARVKSMGIDFAQGFLLHKPEPIDLALGVFRKQDSA